MAERLRTLAARHPGRTLGALAAVAVLGGAVAAGWTERLTVTGPLRPGPALVVVVRGSEPATSAPYRVAIRTMRSQLSADPAVAAVREHPLKGHPRKTALQVRFSVKGADQDAAFERIERNLDPGSLRIRFSGEIATLRQARDDAVDDLALLLLAVPVAALLLVAALGLRRAGVAALAAASSAALAAICCELIGGVVDLSLLSLVGATAAGVLVSMQLYGLAAGGERANLLGVAGLAAGAVPATLGLLGVGYLGAIGVGGALGSLIAVPVSLLAIGATTGLDDAAGSLRRSGLAGKRLWQRIAALVGSRRLPAAAVAVLVAAILLVPAVSAPELEPVVLASVSAPAISALQLGVAIAAAVLATVLGAWVVSRRVLLSVAATLAAALPALAVTGLLVLSFQDGRFEQLLDYRSNHAIHLGSVVAALAIVAALAASQAVCLAGAVRRNGWTGAIEAIGRCGPAATVSCLIGAIAGAALAASSLAFVKEFGVALAAGMVLELLLVQALLAPALLGLFTSRVRPE